MNWIRSTFVILLASCTLPAQQGATVEGKVISTLKGEPVRGATVVLRARVNIQGGTTPSPVRTNYMTETDAEGHFRVTGVEPGLYTCVSFRHGFGTQPANQLGVEVSPALNLKDGDQVTGVVLRLTPLGVISGRVLDPEGDPLSGAEIKALQYGYSHGTRTLEARLTVHSDDRGEFRLFHLFPGQYYLAASKDDAPRFGWQVRGTPPPLSYSTVYYPNTADPARAAPLDLPAGGELRGIDVRLKRMAVYSIRGKMPWDPENSTASINLTLQKRPRDPAFYPRAGSEVSREGFVLQNVTPGSYVIDATLTDPSAEKPVLVARQLVEVVDKDVSNVDLNFTPGLEVSGLVREAGVAVSRLQVALVPMEEGAPAGKTNQVENSRRTAVKGDGSFVFSNLLPDLYQLRIIPSDAAYVTSIKAGDQELADQRLDLTRGVAGAVSIVVAADFGKIEGTVRDDRGRTVTQADVTLIPDDAKSDWLDRFNNYVTDAEGHFVFNNVVPGNYQLFAWPVFTELVNPMVAPASREFRKPYEGYALPVKLEPGVQVDVDVKLIPNKQQTAVSQ